MKIEIDLNDILGDEYGNAENIADSVVRQLADYFKKAIEQRVNQQITELATKFVRDAIPHHVEDVLDKRYTPVDKYGKQLPETSLREQIHATAVAGFVYDANRSSYDKNRYSQAIDEAVKEKLSEFKSQYNKQVDSSFVTEAMAYATAKLKERLKV